MSLFLGIDLGTSSVKTLLVDPSGKVLGKGSVDYAMQQPGPDRVEQDPEDWWQGTKAAIRQALNDLADPSQIAAIGLSGQMHGTLLLDEHNHLLNPAVIWPDRRTQRQLSEFAKIFGVEHLIETTGSPPATGFQALTIRWFQKHHPNLWKQVKKILLPKDYLRWRLTGQFSTDPSDASGTLLMEIRKREWSDNLLDALLIERDMLPPIFESNSIAGELLPSAAEALGLVPGTPVVTGAADTACSMLGAGVFHPDSLLLTLSTAGQLILPAMEVLPDLLGRIHIFSSALPPTDAQAGWYKMGGILSAGLSMRWLRDNIFRLTAADAYERMTSWAEDVPAGANGLLFLPYLIGERTPHMDPNARGIFIGLSLNHGQADLVRAVMEGVSLACKEAFNALTATGELPTRIIMAGGCAQSNLWQQIIADVFGTSVQCLETTEQSALGAALLAGSAIGRLALPEATATWASYGCLLEPDMANHHLYADALVIFRDTYRKHKDDFPKLIHQKGTK